jgi:hypothetical protein
MRQKWWKWRNLADVTTKFGYSIYLNIALKIKSLRRESTQALYRIHLRFSAIGS